MAVQKNTNLAKAKARKEEVKHSRSSLSSLITCFISCFIVVGSCLYSSTTTAAEAVAVPMKATGTTSAAVSGMTARMATLSGNSKDITSIITGRSASYLGTVKSGSGEVGGTALRWDHAVDLNEDFRILWTIINQDITFEIQARTLGYVGFGFSPDGKLAGSDVALGWVDKGQTYFQDRHIQRNGNFEPIVDPSQDYILMLGYENSTHTVLRFRRKLDTCDTIHDIAITNNTMILVFMYGSRDPLNGSSEPGTLPDPKSAFHTYYAMVLTQKAQSKFDLDDKIRAVELRNEDVELPIGDSTLYWCKMFKLQDINQKQHMIRGFTYPDEAGYPIESHVAKYYIMGTHYSDLQPDYAQLHSPQMVDNSGLRIYFTNVLRPNDAGILSIGLDPNWRHIIPPGQKKVISEGQCIEDCTAYAFPTHGIYIFAVMMRTHKIGKEVKLRQIRHTEELPPIAMDANIDSAYQDFRLLPTPVQAMPGDRLIAECIYDSSSRKAITLGGLTMKEESCTALTIYYPRQKELTTCHSLPSLPTVLHSLGITELATDSNPVLISSPQELAGMTLEDRLISYDWQNQFDKFQEATRDGSFKPLCWGANNHVIPGSEYLEGYSINITKTYKKYIQCKPKQRIFAAEGIGEAEMELPVLHEVDNNNIIEGAARSSRSSAATDVLGLSKANSYNKSWSTTFWYASVFILLQQRKHWLVI
ncbi:MOXD1 homolog 2 isoform X2 [Eurosta solidaginis]|uniref:MOXD1 homolog 2 isoform X2 n=1 Tax=Eurosta solidaginis TaxID=178769 RepID=UPI003530DB25